MWGIKNEKKMQTIINFTFLPSNFASAPFSPPQLEAPQEMTVPSPVRTAKAPRVLVIDTTSLTTNNILFYFIRFILKI